MKTFLIVLLSVICGLGYSQDNEVNRINHSNIVYYEGDSYTGVIRIGTVYLPSGTDYEYEIDRYISELSTELNDSTLENLNNFVLMLKDSLAIDSLPEFFDVLYVFANETSESALRNLIKRSHDATAVNSPTFQAFEGYTSNGTTSYITSNYNPSSQGVNYVLNNAGVGVYVRNDIAASSTRRELGSADGTNDITIRVKRDANAMRTTINSANVLLGAINSTALGFTMTTRTASNATQNFKNGVSVATGTGTSAAIPNLTIYILCGNVTGGPLNFSAIEDFSVFYISKGFNSTIARKLNNCVEAYMDSIGKGVL